MKICFSVNEIDMVDVIKDWDGSITKNMTGSIINNGTYYELPENYHSKLVYYVDTNMLDLMSAYLKKFILEAIELRRNEKLCKLLK